MDAMAEALNKALDHNGINEKIVLTGVSMGGYVAFRFAATFAHRLRSLILVATKPTPDPEATRQKRAENIAIIQKDGLTPFAERMITSLLGKTSQEKSPDVVERVRGWILENDPQAVCAALRGMAARPNSSDILSKLNVPVCVMAGEEDTVIPVTEIKAMADQIKKADFQALSGCGHLLPIERPAEFQSAFLNYLKRRVL
jgi:pimeloyl-ACP methyl ester carboxylesterase